MNKYDKKFEGVLNPTKALTIMWNLLDAHPKDKDEIISAHLKQDKKIREFESNSLNDWMTEY